jgi:hypothetical protein
MSAIRSTYDQSNGRCTVAIGVPAMYMTKNIELRFYDSSDNVATLYTKTWEGEAYVYAPQDYIFNQLSQTSDEDFKSLLVAMVTYIGYAQDYFSPTDSTVDKEPLYKRLAEYNESPADVSGISKETVNRANDHGNDATKDTAIGMHLRSFTIALEAAIDLTLKYSIDEGYEINDFTVNLTRQVFVNNQSVVETVPMEVTYDDSQDRYVLVIEAIPAAQWDYEYKITITNNKNGETNTWGTSVLAYLASQMTATKPVQLQNLVKAMYLYNQAASKYQGF